MTETSTRSAAGSVLFRTLRHRRILLIAVVAVLATAACGQPSLEPQAGQVFVKLRITGGIAARDVTVTITGDGIVQTTGQPQRTLTGGAAGASELYKALAASGVYSAAPGTYMPQNTCCDRQTYALTLTRGGQAYDFVTMDDTPSAPPALVSAVGLVQQYANAAK